MVFVPYFFLYFFFLGKHSKIEPKSSLNCICTCSWAVVVAVVVIVTFDWSGDGCLSCVRIPIMSKLVEVDSD